MNDADIFWATIPVNSNTEAIGGITVPKVRAIEVSDPVYYQIDDSMGRDLKERDVLIATAVQSALGGWFNEFISPNELSNDETSPFEYGTIVGRAVTADFPATLSSKAYFQFPLASNAKLDADLNFLIHFGMSTSVVGKEVGLIFRYDIVQTGDYFGTPTVTQTNNENISTPSTQYTLLNYTSANFKITAAQMATVTAHSMVVCSIERDVSIVNNHAGKFMLTGITAYQT